MAIATQNGAPAQRTQTSRKGKKAWRKNVDLTEVEQGLETVRDEIIKGGVIAEKPSNELFVLDTAGSAEIRKHVAKKHKLLKADQIIAQRSVIPAVDTRSRQREAKTTDGVLEPVAKKRRSAVSREQYEHLRKRAFGGETVPKDFVDADGMATHDPWEQRVSKLDSTPFTFLEEARPVRVPDTMRRAPVSLLEDSKKTLPAVARPKGALSYNPIFEDWETTLEQEGAKEVEAEQKRLAAEKAEQVEQARIEAALATAAEEEEAWRTEDESVWEGFESERGESHLRTKLPQRKTPAERNRINRRKRREQEARNVEGMRRSGLRVSGRKGQGLDPVKYVPQEESADAEVAHSSDDDGDIDDRVLRRKRLGKDRIPEKDLELVLPDELQDSLRLLKPEGNLLKDRFRNMMIRGKVETRKPLQQQKKPKRYMTEKWSYKDWKLPGIEV